MRLTAVSKRYGRGPLVLVDIDLDLQPGEVVGLTGPNGSGKSTLLGLLAGLLHPSSGQIANRPRVVGYLPERFAAPFRLSAVDYLTHSGRIRGLTTAAARHRATVLLDQFGTIGPLDGPMSLLSKGNRQRVGLAQTVLVPPDLLLLDEPLTGVDALGSAEVSSVIARVSESGGTVVIGRPENRSPWRESRSLRVSEGRVVSAASAAVRHVRIVFSAKDQTRQEIWVPEAERDRTLFDALSAGGQVCSVDEPGGLP